MLPEIGLATYKLLSRLGEQPIYHQEQTCCGQPLFNAGYRDQAKLVAQTLYKCFSAMTNAS